jgi:hypothetical protein
MRVAFSMGGLYVHGQGLQNGSIDVEGLTSRGHGPYFPKLDSSFCGIRTGDDFSDRNARMVPELLMMPTDVKNAGSEANQGGFDAYPAHNDLTLEFTSAGTAI